MIIAIRIRSHMVTTTNWTPAFYDCWTDLDGACTQQVLGFPATRSMAGDLTGHIYVPRGVDGVAAAIAAASGG